MSGQWLKSHVKQLEQCVVQLDKTLYEEGGMRKIESGDWMALQRLGRRAVFVSAAWCAVVSLAGIAAVGQEKDKSGVNVTVTGKDGKDAGGLVISAQATAKEAGLPLYPGSRPHKEEKDDSSAAKLGLWGSSFGFKLVVLKMESNDSPEKVAAFYQKALGKYGKVLNCTNNPPGQDEKNKKNGSNEITCQDDRPDAGGMLFKAGTKEKQHIVGVTPNGTGCIFHLVYLEARNEEKTPA